MLNAESLAGHRCSATETCRSPSVTPPGRDGTDGQSLTDSRHALAAEILRLNTELATARAARREELREKEQLAGRLSGLVDALPAGVVVLDAHGRVRECNPAAQTLLGESVQGQLWRDTAGRLFAPRSDDGCDISLRNGRRVSLATCSLGAQPGQILVLTDVTETRELQDRLARARRLSEMGEMMAALAHQIRTPLASALLYAASLPDDGLGSDGRSQRARPKAVAGIRAKILERLRRLDALIGDMLCFARQGSFSVSEIEVHAIVDHFLESMRPHFHAYGVEVIVAPPATGRVRGNLEALAGALRNLAENAIQAADVSPKLTVTTERLDGDAVRIAVADNGPGIPLAVRGRVFEPFFTTRSDGTGLGLAIVRGIVDAHRGKLRLDSMPGEGTCVSIDLPLVGESQAFPAPERSHRQCCDQEVS